MRCTGFRVIAVPSPVSAPRPLARLRVLVVEDDEDACQLVQMAIRGFGHECRVALDGATAWAALTAEAVDLVISDWQLPEMSGVELCRRVRSAAGGYVYFLLVSGFTDREHLLEAVDAGVDDFQCKPLDLDELEARVALASRTVQRYRRHAILHES